MSFQQFPFLKIKQHNYSPIIVLGLVLSLTACARPQGDFGRAKPDYFHDQIMMEAGKAKRYFAREDVSTLNLSSDEKQMRNRGWALVLPPNHSNWIGKTQAELRRTGWLTTNQAQIAIERYYELLQKQNYKASEVRYTKLIADTKSDQALLLPYCQVRERVFAADKERLAALARTPNPTPAMQWGVVARTKENKNLDDWVLQSLRLRMMAYRHAINSLELETPSKSAVWDANQAQASLTAEFMAMNKGCKELATYKEKKKVRRSRIYSGWGLERKAPLK
ncbi:hypothetical protein [Polycladidibacter stylochi]|uniref:hypothetical protein n=1 Tax=Polycladidibacter stylochi TaxID=1807766 RepID=UPI00082E026B|nr:hypothetical protein [Pseudovibrio stylochi]